MPTAERHEPDASHQITLLETPIAGSVSISLDYVDENGKTVRMEETSEETVGEGKFKVDVESKKITFNENFAATMVEVVYDYKKTVQEAIIDNKSSAIGEAALIWPVYGSGDDCTESAIIGYYVVKVFRARITQQPGLTKVKPLYTATYIENFLNTEKLSA